MIPAYVFCSILKDTFGARIIPTPPYRDNAAALLRTEGTCLCPRYLLPEPRLYPTHDTLAVGGDIPYTHTTTVVHTSLYLHLHRTRSATGFGVLGPAHLRMTATCATPDACRLPPHMRYTTSATPWTLARLLPLLPHERRLRILRFAFSGFYRIHELPYATLVLVTGWRTYPSSPCTWFLPAHLPMPPLFAHCDRRGFHMRLHVYGRYMTLRTHGILPSRADRHHTSSARSVALYSSIATLYFRLPAMPRFFTIPPLPRWFMSRSTTELPDTRVRVPTVGTRVTRVCGMVCRGTRHATLLH